VSFARGFPRHDPHEFAGEALLARAEADAVLVVGADPGAHLSSAACRRLAEIPTVAVGQAASRLEGATVRLAAAPVEATEGTVFRADGVVVRQVASSTSTLPTEAALLARLAAELAGPGFAPRVYGSAS
jgi:formylmethanofuran dehydrogenase subunit B